MVFLQGEQIGEHLGRMAGVGETIVDRHAGVAGEHLHRLLLKAAELDGVEHPAEHPRRVLERLLYAEVDLLTGEKHRMAALFAERGVERAAGTGRGLLVQHRQRAAAEPLLYAPGATVGLGLTGEVQQQAEVGCGKVAQREQ